jgi:DNA-binding SARP family transcriptional activator
MPRERLLRVLNDAANLPITVIVGPPGSGKTTLLAQYASIDQNQVAWHALDDATVEPETIFAELQNALAQITGLASAPNTSGSLFGVIEQLTFPVTLAIDDLHLVEGTPMQAAILRLAALLPRRGRLVMTSRTTPEWLLATLRSDVDVKRLDAEDLRFRSWEVEQLFGQHYQEPLPPEDAAALSRETEGWAAGLRMFHLSTTGKTLDARRQAVAQLWGKASLLPSYLTDTVLAGLPETVVDFLTQTSALVHLDPTVCDVFLNRTDSAEILEDLARRHLFTIRTGPHSYRYHAVLQGHLEATLAVRLNASETEDLYRRAATALQGVGHDRPAMRAWIRAGDWGAAEQIRQHLALPAAAGQRSSRTSIPAMSSAGDPWMRIAEARQQVACGRLAAARECYRKAEVEFTEPAARQRCRAERVAVEAFLGIGAPYAHERSRDWHLRLRAALRAQPSRLWREAPAQSDDGWQLAACAAAMLDGNLANGGALARSLADSSSEPIRLTARCIVAIVDGVTGGADASARLLELALEAELAGQQWLARMARATRGFFDPSAGDTAATIKTECDDLEDAWGGALAAFAHAVSVALEDGDCLSLFEEAAERAEQLDAPVITCWVRALEAHAAAKQHASEAIDLIREADSCARLAGVPGARAVVWFSEAELDPTAANRLRALAREAAAEYGWVINRMPETPVAARIRCFGGYTFQLQDREVDWRQLRPRASAMLRLLSLHVGQGVHEETLIEALWPEMTIDRARHNLQVAVSSLRHVLDPERRRGEPSLIRRSGEHYALTLPEPYDVDLLRFESAIRDWRQLRRSEAPAEERIAVLTRAVGAYTGDLLPEDGPADWVVSQRERIRLDAAAASAALATLHLEVGAHAAAIREVEQAIRIDPFQDHAWRVLLDAHEQRGDTAALERTRRRYADILDELGVEAPDTPPPR